MAAAHKIDTLQQEQTSKQEASGAAEQTTKQNGGGVKAEVLDTFEIQRRLFFGK